MNLALNKQYAVSEIKYIENQNQAEGIYEIIEKDYKDVMFYFSIQILLLLLILIIDLILRVRKTKQHSVLDAIDKGKAIIKKQKIK
jgi:hypothetical protein